MNDIFRAEYLLTYDFGMKIFDESVREKD